MVVFVRDDECALADEGGKGGRVGGKALRDKHGILDAKKACQEFLRFDLQWA